MLTETVTKENNYDKSILEIEHKLKEYLSSNYNLEDDKISLKFKHTFKTKEASEQIASSLNLSPRQLYISNIIALFHDYGRFKQIKDYSSFNDLTSIDHADLGVELLFNNNEIVNFVTDLTAEELNFVKLAIKYHNKLSIPENVTEEEKLFCNIIRDADKIDIFRILSSSAMCKGLEIGKLEKEELDNFYEHKLYKLTKERNFYSEALLHISYIYDLNFSISFKIIEELNYLKMYIYNVLLFADFKIDKKLLACFEYIQKYLKDRGL